MNELWRITDSEMPGDKRRIIPMEPVGPAELSINMERDAGIRQRFAVASKPKPRKKAKVKDE